MTDQLDVYLAQSRARRAALSAPNFDSAIAELRAQQRASRESAPPAPRYDARDILPDFLRLHAGITRYERACPASVEAWRDCWTLVDIRQRSGYSTADFALALSDAVVQLMIPKFENLNNGNQTLAKNIDVRNYRPVELPTIAMEQPPEVAEDSEFPGIKLKVSASAQDGQLKSYGGKMSFSKSLWSSHGEAIATAIQNYAQVFSGLEAQLTATTLEAASIPSVSGTGMNLTNFSAATEALMQQENAAGQPCNLRPFGMMIPANQYVNALVLRAAFALPSLQIVTNAYLADDNWYLFANPAVSAPLLRLRLRTGGIPRVYADFKEIESGPRFAIEHTIGYSLVNVPGVVKCAK